MAEEIEFRFPSSLPYAYVSVKGTVEELGKLDMEQLASLYANSMVGFKRYEQAAIEYMASDVQRPADEPGGMIEEALKAGIDPVEAVKEAFGATEISDVNEAPYKQPAGPAKPKPWETKKPAATVAVNLEGW